ncbi:MAG: hypothetical protein JSS98_17990 [Bacteroidetes bacterium]|nr:hypothetical protein [Bacteroidota bacterium]
MSISINNSTDAPLLNQGDVFFGKYDDVDNYHEIDVFFQCDGTFRLMVQYSSDEVNIDYQIINDYSAQSDFRLIRLPPASRYFKLTISSHPDGNSNFTNMTFLKLRTLLHSFVHIGIGNLNLVDTNK